VRFAGGAIGTIEATRFATGRKNYLRFEINGSLGSLVFNLEGTDELGDLDSLRWGQYGERSRLPLKWIYEVEQRRFLAYERHIARTFSHALVHTPIERRDFERLIPGVPVSLVGNGVDLDYFRSAGRPKRPASIVFTGVMDYFPNIDAVVWFCNQALPILQVQIPETNFIICGSRPTAAVQRLGKRRGVTVTGRVPDTRPYLDGSEVFVALLRMARGIQNKLLEAMAMGLPCVASTAAASGTVVPKGTGILAADAPEEFAELKLEHPRVWWPYTMGQPNMYDATLSFAVGDQNSDSTRFAFGIREVTSELTAEGNRLFKINGRRILIRGAAWTPDFLFRWSSEKLDADLAYARDMGLNTIRLEGRLDREEFFEKTDRLGILVMPGWTCCDAWEQWQDWQPEQHAVAEESLASQIRILRKHPSVFVWLNGSDNPPPADVEKSYLDTLSRLRWPNPVLSSASGQATTVSGKSGVKMTGPYEYVPPMYWTADTKAGGAYGYNTETSPGPAIPARGSLERFIPKDHLWPIDDVWNFHAGGGQFRTTDVFTDGLNRRYGRARTLDDYLRKSQAISYDGERAMFEAYSRNRYSSTGVIQWLMNNAWPSVIWHLYDYYLVPTGGYFGTKKACEPVHVQYSYDDNSVVVVNNTDKPLNDMRTSATTYNLDASAKTTKEATLNLLPDSSTKAFALPAVDGLTPTYFLRLKLQDAGGNIVSDNFYWLSTKPDTMAWEKSDWAYTPQKDFGDLTGLETLPQVNVETAATTNSSAGRATLLVRVKNPGRSVAFMVHLRLTRGKGGEEVAPILWEDNYFSMLPGEERSVTGTYDVSQLRGKDPDLEVDGFNVVSNSRHVHVEIAADDRR